MAAKTPRKRHDPIAKAAGRIMFGAAMATSPLAVRASTGLPHVANPPAIRTAEQARVSFRPARTTKLLALLHQGTNAVPRYYKQETVPITRGELFNPDQIGFKAIDEFPHPGNSNLIVRTWQLLPSENSISVIDDYVRPDGTMEMRMRPKFVYGLTVHDTKGRHLGTSLYGDTDEYHMVHPDAPFELPVSEGTNTVVVGPGRMRASRVNNDSDDFGVVNFGRIDKNGSSLHLYRGHTELGKGEPTVIDVRLPILKK